ncbi:MAG: VWA domain-containing protein [Azospirillum sp.]|nr:VWA domain-containing protein [Azospirillum sp.]MCZ8123805.1 VWA domain-containing protein [Magnetospirillum sp.]
MSQTAGTLVENVVRFARLLRAAGLPVGPGRALEAVRAVGAVGVASKADLYWSLHAVLVNRRDHREVFDQAFRLFWRDPKLLERAMGMLLPQAVGADREDTSGEEALRRVAEAFRGADRPPPQAEPTEEDEERFDAAMTFSDRELLQKKDFEQMSAEELARAQRAMARLAAPFPERRTRRFRRAPAGRRLDARATIRAMLRAGGDLTALAFKAPRVEQPPLVVLLDISGSMERYARMFLHFLHLLANDRARVQVFLFGTRLTNVTRAMRQKDIDKALAKVSALVEDWSGGTRIGACLREFNWRWARRSLARSPTVLLVTDGLDREAGAGLAVEAERLAKSCGRLVWLNPLLRYEKFEPKSLGVKAILPHVDEFRPVHNLDSLEALIAALAQGRHARGRYVWKGQAA